MKRYCKNIKLDADWIKAAMLECLSDKWNRMDVAGFLAGYTENTTKRELYRQIKADKSVVTPLIEKAAAEMAQ